MTHPLTGIHHITVLASDPQRNVDFYTDVLGLRLVKKTVNFDSPDVYHLYYGDEIGSPGTILTFFPFPSAARGKRGSGEIHAVAFSVPETSIDFWVHRLSSKGIAIDGPSERGKETVITFLDPDGLKVELAAGTFGSDARTWSRSPVPAEHALRGFAGVTMGYIDDRFARRFLTDVMGFRSIPFSGGRTRFTAGTGPDAAFVDTMVLRGITPARQSAGSVHHIAWRVPDDATQLWWREYLAQKGTYPTEVRDRNYFHSIYFREPGGVLFEIATDAPGFLIDESRDELGRGLRLPPWFEADRERIERRLIPLVHERPYVTV